MIDFNAIGIFGCIAIGLITLTAVVIDTLKLPKAEKKSEAEKEHDEAVEFRQNS